MKILLCGGYGYIGSKVLEKIVLEKKLQDWDTFDGGQTPNFALKGSLFLDKSEQ